jgi:hypothetical protein
MRAAQVTEHKRPISTSGKNDINPGPIAGAYIEAISDVNI